MAAGCACIASDAGGIPEIITDGADGIIVPRWELHRLADAVLAWLAADPADQAHIRQSARARAVTGFGFDQERRRLQLILNQLLSS